MARVTELQPIDTDFIRAHIKGLKLAPGSTAAHVQKQTLELLDLVDENDWLEEVEDARLRAAAENITNLPIIY